ncbi:MAG: arsenosugar biosynthesis radical SAM (seleno)protein ArsS [Planctomycetota bacterium]
MVERWATLVSRHSPLASVRQQLEKLASLHLRREFPAALDEAGLRPLRPTGIEVLQVNVGKVCNQACRHCHVDAGPDRAERMSRATMELILDVLRRTEIPTVDITGGAPELNPHFRWFVEQCRELGRHVIDRCNLTILLTGLGEDLPEFLARHEIEVVGSLPHFRPTATDRQRGEGVFERSIEALRRLNRVGYGDGNPALRLVLVTNPVGAFLPAHQASLENEWKREMERLYGIRFNALHTLTNMPISRFLEFLDRSGNLEAYMQKLLDAFNPLAARNVMCRTMISVGFDGTLYDCDFNQMLELPVEVPRPHVAHFDVAALMAREIMVGRHCFGCTAGAGSSCGGAVT